MNTCPRCGKKGHTMCMPGVKLAGLIDKRKAELLEEHKEGDPFPTIHMGIMGGKK